MSIKFEEAKTEEVDAANLRCYEQLKKVVGHEGVKDATFRGSLFYIVFYKVACPNIDCFEYSRAKTSTNSERRQELALRKLASLGRAT